MPLPPHRPSWPAPGPPAAVPPLARPARLDGRCGMVPTDDAFISFRYARNLLEGHSLIFNPGERVEGYSSAPARNRLTDRSAPRSASEAVLIDAAHSLTVPRRSAWRRNTPGRMRPDRPPMASYPARAGEGAGVEAFDAGRERHGQRRIAVPMRAVAGHALTCPAVRSPAGCRGILDSARCDPLHGCHSRVSSGFVDYSRRRHGRRHNRLSRESRAAALFRAMSS